jgi:hypothetical protein
METLKTALYFWNDWIVGAAALAIGIAFWVRTKYPSALVVAIGTVFMFLHTVIEAVVRPTPTNDPMSYFYGGAVATVGILGVVLLLLGGVWYVARDRKKVQSNNVLNTDARQTPPRAG